MKKHLRNMFMPVQKLYKTTQKVQNIYVHLPFCQQKCHFCAFPIHAIGKQQDQKNIDQLKQNYIEHLLKEIKVCKHHWNVGDKLQSIYIGGGTPSLYDAKHLKSILSEFSFETSQISIEINPSQINKLTDFKQAGFNRFSVGIQTFDKETLAKMNRLSWIEASQLQTILQQSNILNLSLDFIIDFCVKQQSFLAMINFIQRVQPQHITLYILEINSGSYLKKNIRSFDWLPQQSLVVEKYLEACSILASMGYQHYQISNFSKKDKSKSKHNQCYWQGSKQFLAFGMGAASLTQGLRTTRPSKIKNYYKFVNQLQGQAAEMNTEQLKLQIFDETETLEQIESIMISGLRTTKGIQWQSLRKILQDRANEVKQCIMKQLYKVNEQKQGIVNWSVIHDRIALQAPRGLLLADLVSYRIIQEVSKVLRRR